MLLPSNERSKLDTKAGWSCPVHLPNPSVWIYIICDSDIYTQHGLKKFQLLSFKNNMLYVINKLET